MERAKLMEIATENKFLRFDDSPSSGKTDRWCVVSTKGAYLGLIAWYGAWRQYCFNPQPDTVYNDGCLKTIKRFLTEANRLHKTRKEPL